MIPRRSSFEGVMGHEPAQGTRTAPPEDFRGMRGLGENASARHLLHLTLWPPAPGICEKCRFDPLAKTACKSLIKANPYGSRFPMNRWKKRVLVWKSLHHFDLH